MIIFIHIELFNNFCLLCLIKHFFKFFAWLTFRNLKKIIVEQFCSKNCTVRWSIFESTYKSSGLFWKQINRGLFFLELGLESLNRAARECEALTDFLTFTYYRAHVRSLMWNWVYKFETFLGNDYKFTKKSLMPNALPAL